MKNTMRKMLSMALVLVMLACAIPFSAFATLDLNEALTALSNAQAQLNDAKNTLDAQKIDLAILKNNQATMQGKVNEAKMEAATKKTNYENLKAGNATQATLDAAKADWDAAEDSIIYWTNQYNAATEQVAGKQTMVDNAQLLVDQRQLAVNAAQKTVNDLQNPPSPTPPTTTKKASLRLIVSDQSGNTITTINREYEPTSAFDLATLIPAGYTFVSMKTGVTSSIVPLTEGQNNRTVIVKANSSTVTPPTTVTPPSNTTETATLRLIVADESGNTISNKTYTGLAVTSAYDLKNLIPSGYTFLRMKSGATSSIVPLTAGQNNRTVIVKANSSTSVSGGSNTSGGIWLGNNNDVVNKDPWPVYLNIYLNGNVSTIAKKVDITKGIAADGYVDLEDVKTVVKSYFNAKDSDGIIYDGLYIFDGSFGGQYTTDVGRVDGYGNINEDRKLSTVNINVMIKNAVAKGSVAADTSNPKTGDMAFLTVTALVASAGALALVYANKKRFLVK